MVGYEEGGSLNDSIMMKK